MVPKHLSGPGLLSRYSDSLRDGRSGDRIPVGATFSAPVPTGPGFHPASCTVGTGSIPGVKRPVRGVGHRSAWSVDVKERVELYVYPPLWTFVACSRANVTLPEHLKFWTPSNTCPSFMRICSTLVIDWVWNVMAHAQKPDFVFRRNGRVHLNRWGCQFSRLLAAEVCAWAVVMLGTLSSEVVWRGLATHYICQFPLHFPSHASPCAITFQLDSTDLISDREVERGVIKWFVTQGTDSCQPVV